SATNRAVVNSAWFRYPRATPAPPTCSSPTTPRGTGSPYASSTYMRVFANGLPIGTLTASPSYFTYAAVHDTVVSVGPYVLISSVPLSPNPSHTFNFCTDSASPVTFTNRTPCSAA